MPEKRNPAKVQADNEKKEAVIYLGPAIPGVVAKGTVFRGGISPQLTAAIQERPAIRHLLVEVSRMAKAKKELKRKYSFMDVCYQAAALYAAEKGAVK